MRRLPAVVLPLLLIVGLGCGRSASEQAAVDLAVRVLGGDATSSDLRYRQEVEGGLVWRYAPTPLSSAQSTLPRPTHLGAIVCIQGDRTSEAVRFSYLHWEPAGCRDGRAQLRRVRRTPAQDARRLDTFISPPRGSEDDPALERLAG